MKEYGLDLSKHNGSLNFDEIKKDNSFVILRAGYGTSTKDERFEEYYKKAKEVGLKVGAYWYSYALTVNDAKTEAKKCLEVIRGKTFEYPIYIDMEDADGYKKKNGMPSNATLVNICNTFCKEVEQAGYYVGIYASESWFNNQLKGLTKGRYDEWLANWGSNDGTLQKDKSSVCRLHQFTSNYKINSKRFDRNISYFDYVSVVKENGLNGFSKQQTIKPTSRLDSLTDEQVADEIIAGKGDWGNGDTRKKKLGTRYDSIQSIVNRKLNKDKKPTVSYYKPFNSTSIVDGLKSIGVNSSLEYRKKIAKANGIKNYNGDASDNIKLLKLAKQGKLKKV